MTDMEHAIEQAARIIHGCTGDEDGAPVAARSLAEAGLLAPAPLTEEWAVGKSWEDPSLGWVAHDPSDEWLAREQAHGRARPLLRRYVTEFLPLNRAEGDGRADRPSWVDEHGINHADGDGGRW